MNIKPTLHLSASVIAVIASCAAASAVTIDQVIDFQNGGDHGWGGPAVTVDIPTDGGPSGMGDRYLSYQSYGGGMVQSRMVLPNDTEMAGNYNAAGITSIFADVANLGDEQLDLRVTITSGTTHFASTTPITVAGNTDWQTLEFPLTDAAMTDLTSSGLTVADVLENVTHVRILSSVGLPTLSSFPRGDVLDATIGIDNVRFQNVPEPATALLLAGGVLCLAGGRRRRV